MESIQHITTDYVLFIKNFLVNYGYTKYCKLVYDQTNDEIQDYKKYLIDTLDDIEIWDKLFDELYYPFKYFYTIISNKEIYNDDHENILNSKTSNTYEIQTFQEYIDSKITLKRVGPADYTSFTKNMNDENFRNNLIYQYETEMNNRIIKNKLIYLIKLQVKYMTYNIEYLTETEQTEIIQYLDIIPYFEYLGKKNWSLETIHNNINNEENIENTFEKTMNKYFEFLQLERKVLAMISTRLL
jgi:hypothetical protein